MWEYFTSIPWSDLSLHSLFATWHMIAANLQEPRRLDSLVSMLPPTCALIGLLLLTVHLLGAGRSRGIRWACILVYLLGAGAAVAAAWYTHPAALALISQTVNLDQSPVRELIRQHHWVTGNLWVGMAAPTFFLLLTSFKTWLIRWPSLMLAVLLALFTLTWAGIAMVQQQELLLGQGVGTPRTPFNLDSGASSATPVSADHPKASYAPVTITPPFNEPATNANSPDPAPPAKRKPGFFGLPSNQEK